MLRLGNGGGGCCFRVYTIFSALFLTNGGKIETFDAIIVFWENSLLGIKFNGHPRGVLVRLTALYPRILGGSNPGGSF